MGHAHYYRDIPLAQVCGSVLQGYLLPPSYPLVLQQTEFLMGWEKKSGKVKNRMNK